MAELLGGHRGPTIGCPRAIPWRLGAEALAAEKHHDVEGVPGLDDGSLPYFN
jgi:hypothetical protein